MAEATSKFLEVRLSLERKTAKQNATRTRQLSFYDLLDLRPAGLPGIPGKRGLEYERQGLLATRYNIHELNLCTHQTAFHLSPPPLRSAYFSRA
ncbi:hypothetical protein D3C86_1925510 [compost metagenome]